MEQKYRVKATAGEGEQAESKVIETNDFDTAEITLHVYARKLRRKYKSGETITVCLYNVTTGDPELLAQYVRCDGRERLTSLVSETL